MKHRKAFTLVEMLVVITLVAVLAGFIVPALLNARKSAKVAIARQEIAQLESAVTAFTAKFGVPFPSGIKIYEQGAGWLTDPRAMASVRQLWPQYDFLDHDIDGNGSTTDVFTLDGAEALVFFLGGMHITDNAGNGKKYQCIGFSASVVNPFAMPTASANQNRVGPFFEFDSSRFQDLDNDGFLEYRDSLSDFDADPIVFYSMYGGSGFLSSDQYTSKKTGALSAYQTNQPAANTLNVWFKSQTFQIIAPGWDGLLGAGGYYSGQDPVGSLAVNRPTTSTDLNFAGKAELDNLTNFNGGQLKDGGTK